MTGRSWQDEFDECIAAKAFARALNVGLFFESTPTFVNDSVYRRLQDEFYASLPRVSIEQLLRGPEQAVDTVLEGEVAVDEETMLE